MTRRRARWVLAAFGLLAAGCTHTFPPAMPGPVDLSVPAACTTPDITVDPVTPGWAAVTIAFYCPVEAK